MSKIIFDFSNTSMTNEQQEQLKSRCVDKITEAISESSQELGREVSLTPPERVSLRLELRSVTTTIKFPQTSAALNRAVNKMVQENIKLVTIYKDGTERQD